MWTRLPSSNSYLFQSVRAMSKPPTFYMAPINASFKRPIPCLSVHSVVRENFRFCLVWGRVGTCKTKVPCISLVHEIISFGKNLQILTTWRVKVVLVIWDEFSESMGLTIVSYVYFTLITWVWVFYSEWMQNTPTAYTINEQNSGCIWPPRLLIVKLTLTCRKTCRPKSLRNQTPLSFSYLAGETGPNLLKRAKQREKPNWEKQKVYTDHKIKREKDQFSEKAQIGNLIKEDKQETGQMQTWSCPPCWLFGIGRGKLFASCNEHRKVFLLGESFLVLLAHGTTTTCYCAAVMWQSNKILFQQNIKQVCVCVLQACGNKTKFCSIKTISSISFSWSPTQTARSSGYILLKWTKNTIITGSIPKIIHFHHHSTRTVERWVMESKLWKKTRKGREKEQQ